MAWDLIHPIAVWYTSKVSSAKQCHSTHARIHKHAHMQKHTYIYIYMYTRIYTSTDELLKREAATVHSSSRYAKWIIDSRSRADRDRRSLQNFTDDRKSRTDHRRSTGAGRESIEQIKSNPKIIANSFFPRTVSGDYRSLPTIISREHK